MIIQTSYLLGNTIGLQISATVLRNTRSKNVNYFKDINRIHINEILCHYVDKLRDYIVLSYLTAFLFLLDFQTITRNPVSPDVFAIGEMLKNYFLNE